MEKFHVNPGPKIGWTLNALLEEILDDSDKNTEEYLDKRTGELLKLPEDELKKLGEAGKQKKEEAEEEEMKNIF